MLAHRLRRWPNIEPTLGERLVFAEMGISMCMYIHEAEGRGMRRQAWRFSVQTPHWYFRPKLGCCYSYYLAHKLPDTV